MRPRHQPRRTCVACREEHEQRELARLAHGPTGLVVDEPGTRRRTPGRGAYVCWRAACWERLQAMSGRRGGGPLGPALRAAIDDEDRAVIETYRLRLAAAPSGAPAATTNGSETT